MSNDPQLVMLLAQAATALAAVSEYLRGRAPAPGERGALLTLEEAAARLRCSAQKLRKGFARDEYPFLMREGKRLVTTEERLGQWLASRARRNGKKPAGGKTG